MIQAIHIPSDSAFVVKREGRAGNRLIQIKYLLFNGMLLDFYSCYSRYKLFLYLKIFTVPLAQLVRADGS